MIEKNTTTSRKKYKIQKASGCQNLNPAVLNELVTLTTKVLSSKVY